MSAAVLPMEPLLLSWVPWEFLPNWRHGLAFAGMLGAFYCEIFMMARALSLLSDQEKLTLDGYFANSRRVNTRMSIAMCVLLVSLQFLPARFVIPGFIGIALLFVGALVWKSGWANRRLRELSISGAYIAAVHRAQWGSYLCWTVFAVFMVLGRRR